MHYYLSVSTRLTFRPLHLLSSAAWTRRGVRLPFPQSHPMSGTPVRQRGPQSQQTAAPEQTPFPVQVRTKEQQTADGTEPAPSTLIFTSTSTQFKETFIVYVTSAWLLQRFTQLSKWTSSAERPWSGLPTKRFSSILSFLFNVHPP